MFNMIDELVAEELGTDVKTYIKVIENECNYWERTFIILAVLAEKKIKKAKEIFMSKLNETKIPVEILKER